MTGLNFFALPDDRKVLVGLGDNGQAQMRRHNLLNLPDEIRATLADNSETHWHPHPLPEGSSPDWIVNHCTDPDTFGQALDWLGQRFPDTPIFNHPDALATTSRDRMAELLSDVERLVVPQVLRFKARTVSDLQEVFDNNGFTFPVLVRPNQWQTGVGMTRVNGPEDWDRALYTRWFGQTHMMIQFVDSQTDEGLFLKSRVIFIGGKMFVRHVKAASQWLVHADLSEEIAGFPAREMTLIDALAAHPLFKRICDAIAERVPLDFFGADIGFDLDKDRFVLFEANPSMSVFFPKRTGMSQAAQKRRAQVQEVPSRHLADHLSDPARWMSSRLMG